MQHGVWNYHTIVLPVRDIKKLEVMFKALGMKHLYSDPHYSLHIDITVASFVGLHLTVLMTCMHCSMALNPMAELL